MRRALSGDRVWVHSYCTLKSGSPLVARQGAAMRDIRLMLPHALPKIYLIGRRWYLMETIQEQLGPPGYMDWNWQRAARAMGSYWLMPESWFNVNNPPFDVRALDQYLEEQGWDLGPGTPSRNTLNYVYGAIPPRLTHGDLTHENTIVDRRGCYKFIDWQAQRHPYIPGHWDVDYGKLMQSLLGWDVADGPDTPNDRVMEQVQALLKISPLAWFWCAIHFMRIRKRAKDEWLQELCDERIELCSWLGQKENVA